MTHETEKREFTKKELGLIKNALDNFYMDSEYQKGERRIVNSIYNKLDILRSNNKIKKGT